ncbi:RNA pseudouridine synthase [Skeletonema marinoi]|uniref:RNA pseudouridine synthase n=1 Tax=Skeletonema marinoi TaxID=267567 RepID=A0AAD8YCC6_9STRA|nr:RNA pseudouridine synthase [Skeletonema marinoi]
MTKTKRNRKRSRGGIGCLIAEDECNSNESSRSTKSLLRVEDVPLSTAFNLIHSSTTNSSDKDNSTEYNNIHCKDQRRVRIVHPYPYTFATFAKHRWLGRPLIDVYHDEFGSYPRSYYEAAIKAGRILVSGKRVTCDYSIKQGDELTHTVHRHEPVVGLSDLSSYTTSAADHEKEVKTPPIEIVYEDDTILVVDKPASMPVLAHWKPESYGTGKLFTVHRLDKLTSGLVLIAKRQFFDILQNANHPWMMKYWTSHKMEEGVGTEESVERQSKQQKLATVPPVSHGEVLSIQVELPILKKKGKKKADEASVNQSACIAALGFWVTDCHGSLVENATIQDLQNNVTT